MVVRIQGEVKAKVQLFPSSWGWLSRITTWKTVRGFSESIDIPATDWRQTLSIPGPVDVTVVGTILGTNLSVQYSVHPDNVLLSLYQGEFALALGASRKFKAKAMGNEVKGTISVEP